MADLHKRLDGGDALADVRRRVRALEVGATMKLPTVGPPGNAPRSTYCWPGYYATPEFTTTSDAQHVRLPWDVGNRMAAGGVYSGGLDDPPGLAPVVLVSRTNPVGVNGKEFLIQEAGFWVFHLHVRGWRTSGASGDQLEVLWTIRGTDDSASHAELDFFPRMPWGGGYEHRGTSQIAYWLDEDQTVDVAFHGTPAGTWHYDTAATGGEGVANEGCSLSATLVG